MKHGLPVLVLAPAALDGHTQAPKKLSGWLIQILPVGTVFLLLTPFGFGNGTASLLQIAEHSQEFATSSRNVSDRSQIQNEIVDDQRNDKATIQCTSEKPDEVERDASTTAR